MPVIGTDPQSLPFWISTISSLADLTTKVSSSDDLNKNTYFIKSTADVS